MPTELFSDVLMLTRPNAGRPAKGAQRARARGARSSPSDREGGHGLTTALLTTLKRNLAPGTLSQDDLEAVAEEVVRIVRGQSVALRLTPRAAGPQRKAARSVLEGMTRLSAGLETSRQEEAIQSLAAGILPDHLAPARRSLAEDNLALRDRFIADTAPLTGKAALAWLGLNGRPTLDRWVREGTLLSVRHRGHDYFPAFQFREGHPHPAIAPVLAALPPEFTPWQRALWFVSPNGWLGGTTPAGGLGRPERVVAAARQEAQVPIG